MHKSRKEEYALIFVQRLTKLQEVQIIKKLGYYDKYYNGTMLKIFMNEDNNTITILKGVKYSNGLEKWWL